MTRGLSRFLLAGTHKNRALEGWPFWGMAFLALLIFLIHPGKEARAQPYQEQLSLSCESVSVSPNVNINQPIVVSDGMGIGGMIVPWTKQFLNYSCLACRTAIGSIRYNIESRFHDFKFTRSAPEMGTVDIGGHSYSVYRNTVGPDIEWAGIILRVKKNGGIWEPINTTGTQHFPDMENAFTEENDNMHCGFLPFHVNNEVEIEFAIVRFGSGTPPSGTGLNLNLGYMPGFFSYSFSGTYWVSDGGSGGWLGPYTKTIHAGDAPVGGGGQYVPGKCVYRAQVEHSYLPFDAHGPGYFPLLPGARISDLPDIGSVSPQSDWFSILFRGCNHVGTITWWVESLRPSPGPSLGLIGLGGFYNHFMQETGVRIQLLRDDGTGQFTPVSLGTQYTTLGPALLGTTWARQYFRVRYYRVGATVNPGNFLSVMRIFIQYS